MLTLLCKDHVTYRVVLNKSSMHLVPAHNMQRLYEGNSGSLKKTKPGPMIYINSVFILSCNQVAYLPGNRSLLFSTTPLGWLHKYVERSGNVFKKHIMTTQVLAILLWFKKNKLNTHLTGHLMSISFFWNELNQGCQIFCHLNPEKQVISEQQRERDKKERK